jgi:Zn-dependent membrane protease YugP
VHPVLILIPALGLIFGPRLWVRHVLDQHNRKDLAGGWTAGEMARQLLDDNRLESVKVESSDIGDHYDPVAKAVRLGRDKIDRKTLTAVTTAAHEVAHAIQDASGYGPFIWRTRLVKVAQHAGEIGSVLFLAIPLAAIFSRNPVPPIVIGSAALAMMGTGVIAQLAALPSELEASFGKALPMLRDGYIDAQRGEDARRILLACSLTYVASSLVAILHIWPWLGRSVPMHSRSVADRPRVLGPAVALPRGRAGRDRRTTARVQPSGNQPTISLAPRSAKDKPVRRFAKSLIRAWLLLGSPLALAGRACWR